MDTGVAQVRFPPRSVVLKDGRSALLREATGGDAAAFRAYLLASLPDSPGVGTYADEIGGEDECRVRLVDQNPAYRGLSLLAEAAGEIVGDCRLRPFNRRKLSGVVVVGMMCAHGWRGCGLGRALLSSALDWARATPCVRRVELGVLATNPGALALYESLGFVVEGRLRGRFLQADGSLADDLQMALDVTGPALTGPVSAESDGARSGGPAAG